MRVTEKMKAFYKRHENKALLGAGAIAVGMNQAHANLDMSKGEEQLALALVAVGALGAAKLAPAALSWVWSLVTRVAQRS